MITKLKMNTHIGNSASTIRWLRHVQALAGILFFIFLLLHLSNTLLAAWGKDVYNNYQHLIQNFYPYPAIEIGMIVLPLLIHTVAGVWLYRLRCKAVEKRKLSQRLNTWAGFLLLLIVFGHMLATRGIGLWFNAPPGFVGVSFSIWWAPAYFYPYYFLLYMAGLYHSYNGVSLLLLRSGISGLHRTRFARPAVMLVGAVGITFSLLAFGGQLFGIAYRMLGSVADAEDVLQDTWLRWHQSSAQTIHSPAAYLTRIVSRLCIDQLRSRKIRDHHYPGPWLPAPCSQNPGVNPRQTVHWQPNRPKYWHLSMMFPSPLC